MHFDPTWFIPIGFNPSWSNPATSTHPYFTLIRLAQIGWPADQDQSSTRSGSMHFTHPWRIGSTSSPNKPKSDKEKSNTKKKKKALKNQRTKKKNVLALLTPWIKLDLLSSNQHQSGISSYQVSITRQHAAFDRSLHTLSRTVHGRPYPAHTKCMMPLHPHAPHNHVFPWFELGQIQTHFVSNPSWTLPSTQISAVPTHINLGPTPSKLAIFKYSTQSFDFQTQASTLSFEETLLKYFSPTTFYYYDSIIYAL